MTSTDINLQEIIIIQVQKDLTGICHKKPFKLIYKIPHCKWKKYEYRKEYFFNIDKYLSHNLCIVVFGDLEEEVEVILYFNTN